MTTYRYNNIWIQHCRTLAFEWVTERDPTYTDAVWNRYTIRVRGFVATSQGAFPGIGDSLDVAATINSIKARLEAPRKGMTYQMGPNKLVEVVTPMDAKLGPDPMPALVREVSSGVFMVECGCVVRVVDCDNQCAQPSPVVSLRWSQTESYDENWNSIISTAGRLIVRSDLLRSADSFRPLATPTLLPDYRRTVSRYTLSPDGTMLDFHFEDREVDRLPPGPCTTSRGVFSVKIEPGGLRTGQVMLDLEGPKGSSRKDLLLLGVSMAYSKLQSEAFQSTPPIVWGEFTEDLFVPRVRVVMGAMLALLSGGGAGAARGNVETAGAVAGKIAVSLFASPILAGIGAAASGTATGAVSSVPTSPNVMSSVGDLPVGVASPNLGLAPPIRKRFLGLLAAAFTDPCACLNTEETELKTDPGSVPPTPALPSVPSGGSSGSNDLSLLIQIGALSVFQGVLSSITPSVETVRDIAPYDTYDIYSTYVFDSGMVQMPATGQGSTPNTSAVVKAHGGSTQLLVTWVAGRTGAPPQLPAFVSPDSNFVPLTGSLVAKDTAISADSAQVIHLASGYYRYAVLDPSRISLVAPVVPFLSDNVNSMAQQSVSNYTNRPVWQLQVATGAGNNPFYGNNALETTPTDTLGAASGTIITGTIGSVSQSQGLYGGGGVGGSGGAGGNFTGPPMGF